MNREDVQPQQDASATSIGVSALLETWDAGEIVNSISITSDGSRIASGLDHGTVCVWDIQTGTIVVGPLKGHATNVLSVAFSPDDTRIVSGSCDGTICLWEPSSGALIAGPLEKHFSWVCSVAFSPDGVQIVSGSWDHTICIWDVQSGSLLGDPLKLHPLPVCVVAFSPDGAYIVSGSFDRTICIWDARSRAVVAGPLKGHTERVRSAAFSPDSTIIASGSVDGTIRLWDAHSGVLIAEILKGHRDSVESVSFSPDGNLLVSGSYDCSICVWDVRSKTLVTEPLEVFDSPCHSVVFSPDGTRIFSAWDDGTIRVWIAPKRRRPAEMISSQMSSQEMFVCLMLHGCRDLSLLMDPNQYSSAAVAAGGFGDIWRGMMKDGVLVAIKCLRLHIILEGDAKGMKRAMRELYHWSKARHENVQQLIGIIMFQNQLGMVSEWMENGTLQGYIRKNPDVNRYELCVQVAKGVSYLHKIGMVHGDIKAVNILVSRDGVAKINDFDYSILSDATLRFSETTKLGGGTLRWMAPELLQHREDDDSPPVMRNKQTDVYALGMTMLEIVSGRVPYHEYQYDMGIYGAISRNQPPRRPKELPVGDNKADRMWTLLANCWDHDPAARPHVSSVLESLQEFALSES